MRSAKTSATFWQWCGNEFHRFLSPVQSKYCANCSRRPRSDCMTTSIHFKVLHAQWVRLTNPTVDDCALKHTELILCGTRSWYSNHCPQVHLLYLLPWIFWYLGTINIGGTLTEVSNLISLVLSILWYQLLLLWKTQISSHFLRNLGFFLSFFLYFRARETRWL